MLKYLKKELYEINNLPKFPYSIREFSYKNLQNPFEEPEKHFPEDIHELKSGNMSGNI
ncbi:MAG: hypothetical protein K940chlam5_00849 [Candidatus Anoxychlamydiales bacterium]|nr:hypothetical protein [Candidatus Anoxychlamydiales bacterium]